VLLPLLQNNLLVAGGVYTLTADLGAYAVSGYATTLVYAPELNAEPGHYPLTGFATTLISTAVSTSSGMHRLHNARVGKKPFVSIDWQDGFGTPEETTADLSVDLQETENLSETDREIQSLLQVAIDKEIVNETEQRFTKINTTITAETSQLQNEVGQEVLRFRRNEALILLLMAA